MRTPDWISVLSSKMYLPDDLWDLILLYKNCFERRSKYESYLSVFSSAITHKPDLIMISVVEVRQTFVRLFPMYHDHLRLIARDLEQYMGPPVNLGGTHRVWFMLHKDHFGPTFPPFDQADLDEYVEAQPGRIL